MGEGLRSRSKKDGEERELCILAVSSLTKDERGVAYGKTLCLGVAKMDVFWNEFADSPGIFP